MDFLLFPEIVPESSKCFHQYNFISSNYNGVIYCDLLQAADFRSAIGIKIIFIHISISMISVKVPNQEFRRFKLIQEIRVRSVEQSYL